MDYRLHFTDAAMAQLEALGLDQDAVRRAINAGWKMQRQENHLVVSHQGLEVELRTLGPDYEVLDLRREAAWPSRKPQHPYVEGAPA